MTDPLKSAVGRTSECPPLEALTAAQPNPDVQNHLSGCSYCRTELALFQEFEAAEPQAGEGASVQWIVSELGRRQNANQPVRTEATLWERIREWMAMPLASRQRGFAMAAASLLIVVAGGVYWERSRTDIPPAGPSVVWRTGKFAAIAPAGDITQPPTELRWEKVEGAARYEIELMQVDRTVIWKAQSEQLTVEIPNNIAEQLKPGRAFQWRVVAKNSTGESLASTDLQSFHIAATTR